MVKASRTGRRIYAIGLVVVALMLGALAGGAVAVSQDLSDSSSQSSQESADSNGIIPESVTKEASDSIKEGCVEEQRMQQREAVPAFDHVTGKVVEFTVDEYCTELAQLHVPSSVLMQAGLYPQYQAADGKLVVNYYNSEINEAGQWVPVGYLAKDFVSSDEAAARIAAVPNPQNDR